MKRLGWFVMVILLLGFVSGRVQAYEAVTDISVQVSRPTISEFPACLAVDGNVHTAPHWQAASREEEFIDEAITYTFTFATVKEVQQLAFFQDRHYPALSYRIWARDVYGQEVLLAEEVNDSAPGGVYIEHWFSPVETKTIRFEPLAGFGFRGRSYPRISDFRVNHEGDPLVVSPQPLEAVVQFDTALSLNGFTAVHDSMFSICEGTWMGASNARQFLQQMNFGMYSHWPFHGLANPPIIPEDPQRPGSFDREFITDGRLATWAAETGASRIRINDSLGAYANVGMITAPPYMRDIASYQPTVMSWDSRQAGDGWQRNAPPEDFAEWGEWMGEIVRALNEETSGVIRDVYIWNEPNTHWYWPVPWDQKPSWYAEFFAESVPAFKELNPGVKVAGPVVSGAGVLAREEASFNTFTNWIKPILDSGYLDSLDVHNYSTHPMALSAELAMVAAYAESQNLPMPPMMSSEGNYSGVIVDETRGVEWRYRTLYWTDLLLAGLEIPDLAYGQSYFFVYDSRPGFLRSRETMKKTPIYWMYWVMRNLRGVRLVTETNVNPQEAVVMASYSAEQATIFVRDRLGLDRDLYLSLRGIETETMSQVSMDYVEFDGEMGDVVSGTRTVEVQGDQIVIPLQAYGLYAIHVSLDDQIQPQHITEKTTVRAREVNQMLQFQEPVTVQVEICEDATYSHAVLSFGIGGIPFHRMEMLDTFAPMKVTVNGESFLINAAIHNEIPIDLTLLDVCNEIKFSLLAPRGDDVMSRTSDRMFLLSAGLDLWHTRDLEIPGGFQLFPDQFSLGRMAPLEFEVIAPKSGFVDLDPHESILRWQEAPFARSYQVIVARDQGFSDIVADTLTSETFFSSPVLRHGELYYAKVRALSVVEQKLPVVGPAGFNAHNQSFRWNTNGPVQISTVEPVAPPDQVSDLDLAQGQDSVFVRWGGVSMVDEYRVYRRSSGEDWQVIAAGVSGMHRVYEDKTVIPDIPYEYAVSGANKLGRGEMSEPAEIVYRLPQVVLDGFPSLPGSTGFSEQWRRTGRWTLGEDGAILRAVFPQAFGSVATAGAHHQVVLHTVRFQIQEIGNPSLAAIRLSTHMEGRDRYQLIYWVNEKRIELLQRTAEGALVHEEVYKELRQGIWYELSFFVQDGVHEVYLDGQRIMLTLHQGLASGGIELYASNLVLAVDYMHLLGGGSETPNALLGMP